MRRFRAGASITAGSGVCSGRLAGAAEAGSACSAEVGVWAAETCSGCSGTGVSGAVASGADTAGAGASCSAAGAAGCAAGGV
ncbi:hypothetical protein C8E99_2795 [Citricoccus muralis]|uniref:Uncharacterized protein n=1 Tax=Citricoccus muralis TaxID=169134 RepID=A0A3D9LHK4_9MICC|nr:hypothetical protein C8E99_2795 [Citricoccus muralis]